MIPIDAENLEEIEEITLPSKDYRMDFERNEITGFTDELEAMKQVVFKILNTERYDWIIYDWDYGIELKDLFGEPIYYVIPELKRRITEALTQDDRINAVTDFEFEHVKNKVHATFKVETVFGDIESESEVTI